MPDPTPQALTWTCAYGCPAPVGTLDDIADHLQAHGHQAERWPDGGVVVVDDTLQPAEFADPTTDGD